MYMYMYMCSNIVQWKVMQCNCMYMYIHVCLIDK